MNDRLSRIDNETSQSEQHGGIGPLYLTLDADNTSYQMRVSDKVIIAITALGDGLGIIILPSLAEACGQFYFITAPTGNTAGDISVYEKETGAEYAGQDSDDGDLDADDDALMVFSDGNKWRTILNQVA